MRYGTVSATGKLKMRHNENAEVENAAQNCKGKKKQQMTNM